MGKHIVTDDILGQITRKEWDLNRRIMEGSIDPIMVLQNLQRLIENQPVSFPLENLEHFQISDTVYTVEIPSSEKASSLKMFAEGCSRFYRVSAYNTCEQARPKAGKIKVCLAHTTKEIEMGALQYELGLAGINPAGSWETVAFIEQSPVTKVLQIGLKFWDVKGGIVQSNYDGRGERPYQGNLYANVVWGQNRKLFGWDYSYKVKHRAEDEPVISPSDYFLILA